MVSNDPVRVPSRKPPDKSVELRFCLRLAMCATLALALAALGACGSPRKAELDREVDRLCTIDGGVHVYEVVRLPKEDFGPDGEVFPQYRRRLIREGRFGPEFGVRYDDKVLVAGDPALVWQNTVILRKSDGKTLGEVVIYGRRGGDGPGLSEPSSYTCPKGPATDLERQMFIPQEK